MNYVTNQIILSIFLCLFLLFLSLAIALANIMIFILSLHQVNNLCFALNVTYLFVLWECRPKLWPASQSEDTNELSFVSSPFSHTSLRSKEEIPKQELIFIAGIKRAQNMKLDVYYLHDFLGVFLGQLLVDFRRFISFSLF